MTENVDLTPVLGGTIPTIPAGDDVSQTIAFYELLGFEVFYQTGDPISVARIRRGQAQLTLQRNTNEVLAQETVYRIPVLKHIDALYESYQALDVWSQDGLPKLGKLEMKPWGIREFHVIDPMKVLAQFFDSGE